MSVATAYRHLHSDAVRLLAGWTPPDARQERLRADYLTHLGAHPDGVAKAGPPAHLTPSPQVFDKRRAVSRLVRSSPARKYWTRSRGAIPTRVPAPPATSSTR